MKKRIITEIDEAINTLSGIDGGQINGRLIELVVEVEE